MINDYANLISSVGFPIVISLYVLIRLEGTINKNTEAINELKYIIIGKKNK